MKEGRPLFLTWLGLLALLTISAASAWVPLGWINTAIGLGIAAVKASLVALVFMRLRRSNWLLRLAALAGMCTLALLFFLSGTDYATRTVVPAPWQKPATVAPRLGSGAQDVSRPAQVAISRW
jgi:cytochrome c oxidase subunit 4